MNGLGTGGEAQRGVQDRYAPQCRCFGCGPANPLGLRIKSRLEDGLLVCDWTPSPHHAAFEGVLCGGIIGTLLDCHCNWAAACHFMQAAGLASPPCTLTAAYSITLRRPTPMDGPLRLAARVVEAREDRAVVEGELSSGGQVTATCRGTFVAVEEGHPSYRKW